MPKRLDHPPDLVPTLSRGKHRSPRKGACFMEMASYLAGERWSDRPRCTHPLLAGLARSVNDHMSDTNRSDLVALIPSVIGLTTDDPRADARIAWRCAIAALPVASASRQNTLAVAVLVTDRVLGDLDGRPPDELLPESRAALESAPLAARWAAQYAGDQRVPVNRFLRTSAPSIVRDAVPAISEACVVDPDGHLCELLAAAIADVQAICARTRRRPPRWNGPRSAPPSEPRTRWRSPSCGATSSSRTSMPWSTPPTAG